MIVKGCLCEKWMQSEYFYPGSSPDHNAFRFIYSKFQLQEETEKQRKRNRQEPTKFKSSEWKSLKSMRQYSIFHIPRYQHFCLLISANTTRLSFQTASSVCFAQILTRISLAWKLCQQLEVQRKIIVSCESERELFSIELCSLQLL